MCAIFGVIGVDDAGRVAVSALGTVQHRGQSAAGVSTIDKGRLYTHKGAGLVAEVFNKKLDLDRALPGNAAIGQVRYPTTGEEDLEENFQPLVDRGRKTAVAHNGNLINFLERRAALMADGATFNGTSDTELFLPELARTNPTEAWTDRLSQVFARVHGAYSLLLLTENGLTAAVDPYNFRPLCYGRYRGGYVFASETVALDYLGATDVRHIDGGEIVEVTHDGTLTTTRFADAPVRRRCRFEEIYFARPSSATFGEPTSPKRRHLGRLLAERFPIEGQNVVVCPVPDSGRAVAHAYAHTLALPIVIGLDKNRYGGRTFIVPGQGARELAVRMKFNVDAEEVRGKVVVLIDDSLVRGTTMMELVHLMFAAGALEVHVLIGSEPVTHPCHYGIDTPKREHLIAAALSIEEIRARIQATSLNYLAPEDLDQVFDPALWCNACFNGVSPT